MECLPYTERRQAILYVCCRDGKSRQNIWGRKTSSTRQRNEFRKMHNRFCISRMTATKNLVTGEVNVEYISTHSGHQPSRAELRFLPLPQSLHKEVQEKFAQGITIEKIMDGKLTSVADNSSLAMLYMSLHILFQTSDLELQDALLE